MGHSAGPIPGSWKKWSITHILSKPASSARRPIAANVSPSRASPPSQVKLGTCKPIFTYVVSLHNIRSFSGQGHFLLRGGATRVPVWTMRGHNDDLSCKLGIYGEHVVCQYGD